MRLPVVALVAIAGLGLFCGSSHAAKMWLPKTDNPYCDVTTYTLREVPEQAMSMLDSNGRPVIVVSYAALTEKPPMAGSSWRMNAATIRSAMCGATMRASAMSGRSPSSISRRR